MKRSERRLLEEKLRYVAMEDVELDPEREQQMLERVKAEFLQQDTENNAKKAPGGHQMGRRVIFASAAAVLIMVISFAFSVFMPESVSHARGFVRSAAIWVNNTLHLGYEFEEPVENPSQQTLHDAVYDSIEEAAANIPYPLVYLDDESFRLQSVSVQNTFGFGEIVISYQNGLQECYIKCSPIAESTVTSFDDVNHTVIAWQHGEIELWEANSTNYALAYYSGLEISIMGLNIPYDSFFALCQTLKVIN